MTFKKQILILFLIFAAALTGVFLITRASNHSEPSPEKSEQHVRHYRLLDVMHELQTYSTKLYFAGTAKNKELSAWYSWKVQQAIRDVQERRIEPYAFNGWDAAELSKMLDFPIADLNKSIANEHWDDFENQFDRLLNTCNACHQATEHGFIVVKAPKGAQPPQNQKFD